MSQPTIDRIMRLMVMLPANHCLSIRQIADRLETDKRTVYRYIDSFRDAGFVV
jgi:predicted DNA-binding transcriptional regulator YafY